MTAKDPKKAKKSTSGQMKADSGTEQYRPAAWGNGPGVFPLDVPSGGKVLARRLGPTALIKEGLLARVDVLSSIVQSEHIDRVAGRNDAGLSASEKDQMLNSDLVKLLQDPEKLLEAMQMIDDIVIRVIVEPTVLPVPLPDPETGEIPARNMGAIYVDSIPEDDKTFLFQWTMGGSSELAPFREKLSERMDDLESLQAVQGEAERPAVSEG